jgi:hypothetical protein
MTEFVALVQQGTIMDQRVVGVSPDQERVLAMAEVEASRLNGEQTGFGLGWSAVVLPVAS